jgi:hypothetical protein
MVRLLAAFELTGREYPKFSIKHIPEVFERGVQDTDWLQRAGAMNPKPVILSADHRILRNKVEKDVLKEAGLTFLLLACGWSDSSWPDQAWKIIKAWPKVLKTLAIVTKPAVYEITLKSKIRRLPPLA